MPNRPASITPSGALGAALGSEMDLIAVFDAQPVTADYYAPNGNNPTPGTMPGNQVGGTGIIAGRNYTLTAAYMQCVTPPTVGPQTWGIYLNQNVASSTSVSIPLLSTEGATTGLAILISAGQYISIHPTAASTGPIGHNTVTLHLEPR